MGVVQSQAYFEDLFNAESPRGPVQMEELRDLVATIFARTGGWGDYGDGRGTGDPISIPATTDTEVLNQANGTLQLQELPVGDNYPDGLVKDGKIQGHAGDAILITVEFKIRRASGSGEFSLSSWFEIGLPGDVELYRRTTRLPGTGDQNVTFTTSAYTLDTWAANGASLMVNTSVATEIYDLRYVVALVYTGQGTYPPA